jgi:hypothetical protein
MHTEIYAEKRCVTSMAAAQSEQGPKWEISHSCFVSHK